MPVHDWTRVPAGLFHHFHQDWSIEIARALNRGLLPRGLSALVEQRSGVVESDVLTIEGQSPFGSVDVEKDVDVATIPPPRTRVIQRTSKELYARRANRIVVKHHLGRVLAVIEIISPGNKDSRSALREFVEKSVAFLSRGIHLLIVDLFPPTVRDPSGIHKAIWDEFEDADFTPPTDKDRTLVSYHAGDQQTAYVEPIGVGDSLPDMPLFLSRHAHILVPLEPTYATAWAAAPEQLRAAVE